MNAFLLLHDLNDLKRRSAAALQQSSLVVALCQRIIERTVLPFEFECSHMVSEAPTSEEVVEKDYVDMLTPRQFKFQFSNTDSVQVMETPRICEQPGRSAISWRML